MWCLKSLKLASIIIILSGETYYWGHRHAVIWRFFYSFKKDKLTSGGYSLWWPIREGSVRKGYGFFRPQIHERVGISLIEAYKRVVKSVIWVCERAQKGKQCSVLQKFLSNQLPIQSNWCLTPSADRARVSKGGGGWGVGHASLENFKKQRPRDAIWCILRLTATGKSKAACLHFFF